MANALYTKTKQKLLEGYINITSDTIKATLVDTASYTVNLSTHDFIADIAGGARIASATMSGKSVTDGVFDASDTTFSSVSGATVEAIVIWQDTGTEANSALLAYIDSATGLPVTPNGGDITVVWDSGVNKIFALS